MATLGIEELVLTELPDFPEQFRHDFIVRSDNSILGALEEITEGGRYLGPDRLSNVGGRILVPTATSSLATIDGGWRERRLRFTLTITDMSRYGGARIIRIISGYTDHVGLSFRNSIDPAMKFYINDIQTLREIEIDGFIQTNVIDNDQFIINPDSIGIARDTGGILGAIKLNNTSGATTRPVDVAQHSAAAAALNSYMIEMDDVDTSPRYQNGTSSWVGGSKLTTRSNNVSTRYLSKYLTGMRNASKRVMEQPDASIDQMAADSIKDRALNLDSVLSRLQRVCGVAGCGYFRYEDLFEIVDEKDIDRVTRIQRLDSGWDDDRSDVNNGGSSTVEAVIAKTVANEITTYLTEASITNIQMSISNATVDGSVAVDINPDSVKTKWNLDERDAIDRALANFENNTMPAITNDGDNTVDIEIDYNVDYKLTVAIIYEDGHIYRQTFALWCDSLTPPVISTLQNLEDISLSLQNITRSTFDDRR